MAVQIISQIDKAVVVIVNDHSWANDHRHFFASQVIGHLIAFFGVGQRQL